VIAGSLFSSLPTHLLQHSTRVSKEKTEIIHAPSELPSVGRAHNRSPLWAHQNGALGKLGSRLQFNRQIAKFNTLAKLTHARYGTINQTAIFEVLKNAIVVTPIASHRTTISTNAQPG
jgi:hypothetical protein